MQHFGEPEGRVKIQMMSKNLQRYYTLKCLIRDLLSNVFVSPKSDLPRFFIFLAVGGIRRVQISCDICTRFARYLYSTKQSWIIKVYIFPQT